MPQANPPPLKNSPSKKNMGLKILCAVGAVLILIAIIGEVAKKAESKNGSKSSSRSVEHLKPYCGKYIFTGPVRGMMFLNEAGDFLLQLGDGGKSDYGTWDVSSGILTLKGDPKKGAPQRLKIISNDKFYDPTINLTFTRFSN